jgi:hypothetical protein
MTLERDTTITLHDDQSDADEQYRLAYESAPTGTVIRASKIMRDIPENNHAVERLEIDRRPGAAFRVTVPMRPPA